MKWFKDLKIGTKLFSCFMFLAVVAAVIGWAGLSGVSTIQKNGSEMYADQLVPIRDLGFASTSLQLARACTRDMLVDKNVANRQKFVDIISVQDKKIEESIDDYSKTNLSKEEQDLLPKFESSLEQYRKARNRAMDLLLRGQDAAAWALIDGDAKQFSAEATDSLRKLIDINCKLADEHQRENKAAASAARNQVLALLAFGVLASIGSGIFLARMLGRPLRAMEFAAQKLAIGDVNVTIDLDSKDELGTLAASFREMIAMIKDRATLAQRIAAGDVHMDVKPKSEQDLLGKAFLQVVDTLRKLIAETERLTTAATQGKLTTRGEAQQFEGGYRLLVDGINTTLDAVIGPLNVAAECFNKIGNGVVPQRITEDYRGDFASLKDNVNNCITGLQGLEEANSVLQLVAVNDYTRKVNGHYAGLFGNISTATNQAMERLQHVVQAMGLIADGNFRGTLDEMKQHGKRSENDTLVPTFMRMMEAIVALVDDANMLANAAVQGKLATRADAARHNGDYRKVVEGVNATLDAVIRPLNVAAECFNQIGNGLVPQRITKEYSGDFAALKDSLNNCITGLEGLQRVSGVLQRVAVNDYTMQVEGQYPGLFGEVGSATNLAIARLQHAVKVMGLMADGNFREELKEVKRQGKRSENDTFLPAFVRMMEAIVALVDDANMLASAAVHGKLATRADATRHQGDYRKVVEGVNATLDAVIGPLKDIERCLAKLANGDFTAQVDRDYAGDFNEVKAAVNTMIAQVRGALLKIGKETNTLASASEQLGRVSQQMSASAEETAAQANVVSAASEQVSTNIQTVATGADEMGASIKEIAKNTADATKIANNAVQLSKTTNETVRKLGASSAEIGQVIKVITSIAQQTNLLALNATIEAARAGEAGKGFAVVANEVKELAKQTAQATEDISQKIQAIQQDAGGAVTAIGEITEVIGQISDIQNTVATAIEEQSATTNEISRNLAEAAKGGADITLNITSVAQVAKTTTEAAGQTQMSAKSLEDTAAQLRELVSQFRYEDGKQMALAAHAGR